MYIIDAHNHIGSRRGRKGQSAEEMIEKMDKSGIDKAVVFPYVQYPNNDYIVESVKKYPDRLIGFAVLDHNQPDQDKVLEKLVLGGYIKGVKLDTPTRGFSIDDFHVVGKTFEVCNKYHLPVICYCGDNIWVHPYKFAECAKRYPNVNFIMAHAGVFFMTGHAIEVCAEYPNLYIEISNINAKVINDAKDKGVLHKVLFGTDMPFNYFEVMIACVEAALQDEEEKRMVYSQNMQGILNQIRVM